MKALLKAGQTVELRERNRVLGSIVPKAALDREAEAALKAPAAWLDAAARWKAIFGDQVPTIVDDMIADRKSGRC